MTAEDGVGDAKMELPSLRKVTTSAEPSVNAAREESLVSLFFFLQLRGSTLLHGTAPAG